jgi:Flp pilus assembly pilin Flp
MTKLFTKVQSAIAARRNDEEGAAMVEYGLLVAGIALVAVVGVNALGVRVDALFDKVIF